MVGKDLEEEKRIINEANNPENAYVSSYMLCIPVKFKMVLDVDRKVIIEELGNEAKELMANIALMSMTDDSVSH